jgi:hypothetical protein
MEDMERYLDALQRSDLIAKKIIDTLEEDKQNIYRGLSGEPETVYKKHCDKAIDKMKAIRKKAKILYSESSAGL